MSTNTFSVYGLISWLERQDLETKYAFCDTGGCLLYQYFQARGVPLRAVAGDYWRDVDLNKHSLPLELRRTARGTPHTYGAALARAKSIAGET